jgi:threonine aldolase
MHINGMIDLRSDTVTQPSPEMRRAIYQAEVGDDSYGDDPTVRALEEKAAERLGKEAALLVLSGTMGNLVSLMALTHSGESVVLAEGSHILVSEGGGLARIAGLTPRAVSAPRGLVTPEAVDRAMLSNRPTNPLTSLVCIENTNNAAGGCVVPVEAIDSLCTFAHEHGLKVHMDGARLFNAEVALGIPAARIVEGVDTVTFCLSKGLACPAGAIVAGDADFVAEARVCRQTVGGGMRQAGIFAAAGIVALDCMIERLAEDHENARLLRDILVEADLPVTVEAAESNMVYIEVPETAISARTFVERVRQAGVLVNPPKGRRVRMVTHYGIDRDDVREAAARIIRCLNGRDPRWSPVNN